VNGDAAQTGTSALDRRTIEDFGRQWTTYTENAGYYASVACLEDVFGPLYDVARLRNARIGDIGSGTGRIVDMLLDAGASTVVAVEPSDAFEILKRNTAARADRVVLVHGTGDAIPDDADLDVVVAIGVLHHVVDPAPIVRAARAALRPGGTFLVWLYGREGNGLYLATFGALRAVTTRLPDAMLAAVAALLEPVASAYASCCRWAPLPMRRYMLGHFARLDRAQRRLTIYDQLNPAYAKYYREHEARALLEAEGFVDVRLFRRHGYSWTVAGRRPDAVSPAS
jgi:SAM-dependent methyltransferase